MAVVEPFGKYPVDFLVTLGLVCGPAVCQVQVSGVRLTLSWSVFGQLLTWTGGGAQ